MLSVTCCDYGAIVLPILAVQKSIHMETQLHHIQFNEAVMVTNILII